MAEEPRKTLAVTVKWHGREEDNHDSVSGETGVGFRCRAQSPNDPDSDLGSVSAWRLAWNKLDDSNNSMESSKVVLSSGIEDAFHSSTTCSPLEGHNGENYRIPVPPPCGECALPRTDERSRHGNECPRYELFHLRTNKFLDRQFRSSALVVNAKNPYHVLVDNADPWINWKPLNAFQSPEISVPGAFGERISSRRDREAVLQAFNMLCGCPTGFVTLAIRNYPPRDMQHVAPFLFLVMYSPPGCATIVVDISVTCNARLHPTLHVDWCSEMGIVRELAAVHADPEFDKSYASDTADNEEDVDEGGDEGCKSRDPLELASTSRLLLRDLIRRVAASAQIDQISTEADSSRSPERTLQKERGPTRSRSARLIGSSLAEDIQRVKRGIGLRRRKIGSMLRQIVSC